MFDKTGTLTEDGITIHGIKINQGNFKISQKSTFKEEQKGLEYYIYENENYLDYNNAFIEVLACCHSVTLIKGQLMGDPLEIEMFECSGWTLIENSISNEIVAMLRATETDQISQIEIVKRFNFESKLMRSSVIAKKSSNDIYRSFVKGSPEKLLELCLSETIPDDFHQILDQYTFEGYRVIALASKILPNVKSFKDAN